MPKQTIQLGFNDEVDITLPSGRVMSVLLSYLEPVEQFPEIDIRFPTCVDMNCFGEHLQPAKVTAHGRHILEGSQVIVPLPDPD